MNRTQTTDHAVVVAAYETLDGAERAATHLVTLGYSEHDVGIAPRSFEEVDPHPLRRLLATGVRRGAIGGVIGASALALGRELGLRTLVESILPVVAWGVLAGVVIGGLVAVATYRRQRARAAFTPPKDIAPTRYEVVVDRDPDRARHGLARWWDPAARPTRWQQPA